MKPALTPAEIRTAHQGPEAAALSLSARRRRAVPAPQAGCSWPTTWGWARRRRRSPACDVLWRTGRIRRGLIIAPASLKPQWAREWAQLLRPARSRSSTARPPNARRSTTSRRTGLFIINYEQLLRDLEIDPRLGARPGRARRGAADQELGDEDGALGQGADSALPPGADRHADGEPDRGAGLDRRVGRRHGAGAQVAARRRCTRSAPTAAARSSASATSTRSASGSTACMVRRVRQDVLDQLPPRTDTRVPDRDDRGAAARSTTR